MLNALGPPFFIIVVIAVVGWFALATQRNVRKGNDALRWLQDGLKLLGEKTNLRWLGSSVVELTIPSAKEPFRQAEVVVVLEPRDVPFLWWYYRARGRRDLLIVRGQLRRTPGFEFEALDPRCWTYARHREAGTVPQLEPGHAARIVAARGLRRGGPPPATQLLEAVALTRLHAGTTRDPPHRTQSRSAVEPGRNPENTGARSIRGHRPHPATHGDRALKGQDRRSVSLRWPRPLSPPAAIPSSSSKPSGRRRRSASRRRTAGSPR